MRTWVVVMSLIAAVMFIGLGVVFVRLDLGIADQVASVASFFVGLAALITAIVFSRHEPRTRPVQPQEEPPQIPGVQFNGTTSNVQIGNGTKMKIIHDHRKRRWFQR